MEFIEKYPSRHCMGNNYLKCNHRKSLSQYLTGMYQMDKLASQLIQEDTSYQHCMEHLYYWRFQLSRKLQRDTFDYSQMVSNLEQWHKRNQQGN